MVSKNSFPKPNCEMGYSFEYLEEILSEEMFAEFNKWHYGQTGSICEGRQYNHVAKEYEPSACANSPHGFVAYRWDVERFLGMHGQAMKDWWD